MGIEEQDGISVIIPIYNASKYLHRTIDSVLNQTYKDIELILVNDGSKDNSLAICREFENKDERVVVIDKENGGVSSARNAGIERATKKYIAFMDNDDYMIPTYLETMHKYISMDGGRDLLVANAFHIEESTFDPNMELLKNDNSDNLEIIDASDISEIRDNFEKIQLRNRHWTIWNLLFVRKIIIDNRIIFVNKTNEDQLFALEYISYCHSMLAISNYRGYVFMIHNTSQSHSLKYIPDDFESLDKYILLYNSIIEKFQIKSCVLTSLKQQFCFYHLKSILNKGYHRNFYKDRHQRIKLIKANSNRHDLDAIKLSTFSNADKILILLIRGKLYALCDTYMCCLHKLKKGLKSN